MMDGRRHSVDIPITRTLIALRRVRSLRDPSTNSMSKFSSLLENVNWETNSSNEISLRFVNGERETRFNHTSLPDLKSSGLDGQAEKEIDEFKLWNNLDMSRVVDGLDHSGLACGNKSWNETERAGNSESRGLDLVCSTPLKNHLEDFGLTNDFIVGSPLVERIEQPNPRWTVPQKDRVRSSWVVGDALSRVSSPCLSGNDALSNHGTPMFASEETDLAVRCCWTRTPRFRQQSSSYDDDVEGSPLLSCDLPETTSHSQSCWKPITCESPRSLSQKFRPKSFHELVGQDVVARSLMGAISSGRITSLCLFHGPRGTGKTSASRIFAAALNCMSLEEYKPCGLCRECVSFFSGSSRDVKEVDSLRINRDGSIRSLVKNASTPPVSSRFKIFIIDECHLLHGETWATVLDSLANLYQHAVFVMITSEIDKLPRSAVARSQLYQFQRIKDGDIAKKLGRICVEEGIDFDQDALDFIAAKSNGSLRAAEVMLDQLSLLGRRVTIALANELIGVVSDDELLDLLDLALSSDTSNTVIRARELMRSRIDPMQLVSQLANLIMDILAGKCHEHSSDVRKKFSKWLRSEVDLQRLKHALKLLSETEKQLRVSKSQSTWLTVALLQLSSIEPSSDNPNDLKSSLKKVHEEDGDFCSTLSPGESLKHPLPRSCPDIKSDTLQIQTDPEATLDTIWRRALELLQSSSLKSFLWKQGKLSSLCANEDLAVAELEFHHSDHAAKAERSWKLIASSLQSILSCNVEIRIMVAPVSKRAKPRRPSFSLFTCLQQKSLSNPGRGSDSECSDHISEMPMMRDLTCSSDCRFKLPPNFPHSSHRLEAVRAFRNSDGNVLCIGTSLPQRSLPDDSSKEEGSNLGHEGFYSQSNCFPRTLKLQSKLRFPCNNSHGTCMVNRRRNQLAFSDPAKKPHQTFPRADNSFLCFHW